MKKLVLDISYCDPDINLAEWVERHDLWAVITKAGGYEVIRRNGGPEHFQDNWYDRHYNQAKSLGLHTGAYFYTIATDVNTARQNADYFATLLAGRDMDMPVYADIEDPHQLSIGRRALTDVIEAFCDRMAEHGYMCGVYTGRCALTESMLGWELHDKGYPLWVAEYSNACHTDIPHGMWQFGAMHVNGSVIWSDSGGYRDGDWCYEDYPSIIKGGGKMARRMIDPAEEAAEIHAFMCTDPRFGYSQDPRWGGDYNGGEVAVFTSKAGYEYRIPCGSYDCSSSSTLAWRLGLSRTRHAGCLGENPHERTASMRATFCGTGLFTASLTNARRGDLYLNEGVHVAMCQCGDPGNDILSEFVRDENHGASGGRAGDQDGGESIIRGYYDDNWNTVLHYVGGLLEDVTDDGTAGDAEVTPMGGAILYDGSDGRVYYWTGDPECVPYHVNGAEKKALEKVYGLKLRKLDRETAATIMDMCKARKGWREDGIASRVG